MRRLQSDGSRLLITSLIRDCRFDSSFLSLLLTPTGLSRLSMSALYMEAVTLLSVDLGQLRVATGSNQVGICRQDLGILLPK